MTEWEATRAFSAADAEAHPPPVDAWQATRAQTALATQFLRSEDDYLAGDTQDIGRPTGADERELFVSCDPAQAMRQQFEHLQPEYIAVHDIGTASSRKLLLGIAAASGRRVQKLIIRRQGYGTPLATLEFVEVASAQQRPVRLYTTEADADTQVRQGLSRVIMGFSRLTAVIVGELPSHAIAAAMQALNDDIARGPWTSRDMLLLPLTSGSAVATHGMEVGRGRGLTVKTTPQVLRPADAWSFITATWNRLREQNTPGGNEIPELGSLKPLLDRAGARRPVGTVAQGRPPGAVTTSEPVGLRALPGTSAAPLGVPHHRVERYVRQVGDLTGVLSCCVFEMATGRAVAQAGRTLRGDELALRGMELLGALRSASGSLGAGGGCPEAALTFDTCHLILRAVPTSAGLALHAMLDRTSGNLTLVRLQILRMDPLFEADAPG